MRKLLTKIVLVGLAGSMLVGCGSLKPRTKTEPKSSIQKEETSTNKREVSKNSSNNFNNNSTNMPNPWIDYPSFAEMNMKSGLDMPEIPSISRGDIQGQFRFLPSENLGEIIYTDVSGKEVTLRKTRVVLADLGYETAGDLAKVADNESIIKDISGDYNSYAMLDELSSYTNKGAFCKMQVFGEEDQSKYSEKMARKLLLEGYPVGAERLTAPGAYSVVYSLSFSESVTDNEASEALRAVLTNLEKECGSENAPIPEGAAQEPAIPEETIPEGALTPAMPEIPEEPVQETPDSGDLGDYSTYNPVSPVDSDSNDIAKGLHLGDACLEMLTIPEVHDEVAGLIVPEITLILDNSREISFDSLDSYAPLFTAKLKDYIANNDIVLGTPGGKIYLVITISEDGIAGYKIYGNEYYPELEEVPELYK